MLEIAEQLLPGGLLLSGGRLYSTLLLDKRCTDLANDSSVAANHFGTVLISFAGASHNMTATADADVPAGRQVKVVAVAGTNLVVAAIPVATNEGARSDA